LALKMVQNFEPRRNRKFSYHIKEFHGMLFQGGLTI